MLHLKPFPPLLTLRTEQAQAGLIHEGQWGEGPPGPWVGT